MTIIRNKEKGTEREPGREKCSFLNFDQSYLRTSEPKMCSTTKKNKILRRACLSGGFLLPPLCLVPDSGTKNNTRR